MEKKVFGVAEMDADYPKDSSKIVDAIYAITTQMNAATAGRSRIEAVFKRIGELEQYIDPAYIDQLLLSSPAKADILLSDESSIREHIQLLEQVEKASPALNSEHIKVLPALKNKLSSLCQIHLTQQDKMAELTDETKRLVTHYNNIISLLANQLVVWDEMITKLEQDAARQHNADD
jgi:hypothetical protein